MLEALDRRDCAVSTEAAETVVDLALFFRNDDSGTVETIHSGCPGLF